MHTAVLVLTGLLLAFAPLVAGAQSSSEAPPTEAETSEDVKEEEASENPTEAEIAKDPTDVDSAEAQEEAGEGFEQIVIQAGESDAVSDYESGDSVTGFDAADLEALGAQSVADLAAFTPNLEIVTSGQTTPTFFIRGVGLNDFNPNSAGAVALYQDDVPLNAAALQLGTLFDMEAVNVLRGPQGKGGFRNASAGAIKLYSRKPTGEFGGFLRSTYGNYDARDFEGAIEAPIWEDMLAGRFAFRLSQRDGFGSNRCGDAAPDINRGVHSRRAARPRLPNDPRWSICGEDVTLQGNPIGPGQPRSSGISLIEDGLPTRVNDLNNWSARGTLLFQPTLDSEWTLVSSYAKRDELSRLGQSYGINVQSFRVPEGQVNGVSNFTLGGEDGGGYTAPEVTERLAELMRTGQYTPDTARLAVARDLARNLDDDPWKGDYNRVGPTKNDVFAISLKGETMIEDVLLTTIFGYNTYKRLIDVDLDNSPNPLFEIITNDDGRQLFGDIHLSGEFEDTALRWEIGGFYLQEELRVRVDVVTDPLIQLFIVSNRNYTQKLRSAAGWVSFGWDFWDDFTLDGGVRYNWEHKKMLFVSESANTRFPGTGRLQPDATWQDPTGEIRLTYRFREDTHAYLKYTRGWKGGHFNATSDASDTNAITVADPERIDSFEMGLRGSWFDGRLGLDTSVFHYDYRNYQIFTAEVQVGGTPNFVILNANNAEVYGAEVDLTARPLPGMFLQANFGWLESQFLDFTQVQTRSTAIGNQQLVIATEINNTGNRLLNSPKFKVSLTAEQMFPLGRFGSLTFRWDGAWSDDTNFDATNAKGVPTIRGDQFLPDNTIGQRAFWLHNLRLAYRTPEGGVEVAGFVRNLQNKAYKTFAFDASSLGAFRTTVYFVGDPRTYGLSVTTTF